jgi:hypothetical protein
MASKQFDEPPTLIPPFRGKSEPADLLLRARDTARNLRQPRGTVHFALASSGGKQRASEFLPSLQFIGFDDGMG